ncbi:hypothetical protein SCLCIDRAFT_22270 [Scleroderma citrinum Foug A]|uniref:Uncharacterized protein n=1 Tax=Scleroderma citrinum Foug A TaxID=1036808 RepID=A0A0C3ECI8_9AGAM|nr:hypothetical protein SCLCIDRAFT_22270 [Scleroderma citrinum Foug A]
MMGLSSLCQPNFTDGNEGITRPSNPLYPDLNETSLLLGDWYWNYEHQKSQISFKKLLDIIGHPDYHPNDVQNTNWAGINQILGSSDVPDDKTKGTFKWLDGGIGWKKMTIWICVPFHRRTQNPGPKEYIVEGFYHCSLVDIICENVSDPTHHQLLHYKPYKFHWQPPHKANNVRVYGELYTSESLLTAQCQLQDSLPELRCTLPRHIIGLMLWSDATYLTTFGTAKLWPLYVYMGNKLKYMHCKPSSNLCSHAAYFHTLPDAFKDFVAENASENTPGDSLFTHCHRELFHVQWGILLDAEFVKAYHHGVVCHCFDGIDHQLYPRIFTYSADYPEKVLTATIWNMGAYLCPRCLTPKSGFHQIATERDMLQWKLLQHCDNKDRRNKVVTTRRLIYKKHYVVHSSQVEELLKNESLVPTLNAFSESLSPTGFDLFRMLVIDLLHEFELGLAGFQAGPKESLPENPEDHHHIGHTQKFPEDLLLFVRKNSDDPLTKSFIPWLKAHLLPHVRALHEVEVSGTSIFDIDQAVASDEDSMQHLSTLSQVIFKADHIYCHHLFHVNYTTYDIHRAQDTINP